MSQAARPTREIKKPFAQVKDSLARALREYWDDFDADTKEGGDGEESCSACVTIGGKAFQGETGKGCGHAEMHALAQYADSAYDKIKGKVDIFEGKDIVVSCPGKPCCLWCSVVLGIVGAGPKDAATTKASKRMGSTSWGVSDNLARALAIRLAALDASVSIDHWYEAVKQLDT